MRTPWWKWWNLTAVGLIVATIGMLNVIEVASSAKKLERKIYPGTNWSTVYGDLYAVSEYCSGALGEGMYHGCFLPERKEIVVSDLDSCLHEAVHAVDPGWGMTPQHRRLFRSVDE